MGILESNGWYYKIDDVVIIISFHNKLLYFIIGSLKLEYKADDINYDSNINLEINDSTNDDTSQPTFPSKDVVIDLSNNTYYDSNTMDNNDIVLDNPEVE